MGRSQAAQDGLLVQTREPLFPPPSCTPARGPSLRLPTQTSYLIPGGSKALESLSSYLLRSQEPCGQTRVSRRLSRPPLGLLKGRQSPSGAPAPLLVLASNPPRSLSANLTAAGKGTLTALPPRPARARGQEMGTCRRSNTAERSCPGTRVAMGHSKDLREHRTPSPDTTKRTCSSVL